MPTSLGLRFEGLEDKCKEVFHQIVQRRKTPIYEYQWNLDGGDGSGATGGSLYMVEVESRVKDFLPALAQVVPGNSSTVTSTDVFGPSTYGKGPTTTL